MSTYNEFAVELEKIQVADSLWQKTVGVMFWQNFGELNGLLLTDTSAIHTFFVRFPLDLVFLNKNSRVIKTIENLKPWRLSPIVWQAKNTLELPAGSISKHKLAVGDLVKLK